jgi:hypothetical protein
LDFAHSVEQVDAIGEMRLGFHRLDFRCVSLVLLLQHQPSPLLSLRSNCAAAAASVAFSVGGSTVPSY